MIQEEAELTWCLKYLICELTPERRFKQCLYPEGTILTDCQKARGEWGSVRRKRSTCEGASAEGVLLAQCWDAPTSCLLPPSPCLAAASFIQVSTHLSCPLVTTRSSSSSVDWTPSLPPLAWQQSIWHCLPWQAARPWKQLDRLKETSVCETASETLGWQWQLCCSPGRGDTCVNTPSVVTLRVPLSEWQPAPGSAPANCSPRGFVLQGVPAGTCFGHSVNFVTLETDHDGNGRRHHCPAAWFYPLFLFYESCLQPRSIFLLSFALCLLPCGRLSQARHVCYQR